MNTKELAAEFGFDKSDLEDFILGSNYKMSFGLVKHELKDEEIEPILRDYKQHLEKIQQSKLDKEQEEARQKQAALDKKHAMASMLITSGFNFDGYTISKYSGYISGDDAVQISRGTDGIFSSATNVCDALMRSLVVIRRNALNELKEAAYDLGCNAVVGVDFDYLTLDPETARSGGGTMYLPYVFGVTANGNAVVIEKNDNVGQGY
ncbi:MAG: heavy metal-binding domain-containing protein [Eggerthellaceae bacterium]|jgi:uncharacterized protein YbjQ (UPF0145 family)|nr:heavy metal-binding domain-containing protein [Eggerthellaceae bacterium]MCH4221745.1 heavy metal-binding domain-containing protein [Eggerthellaceae bacterium]